MRVYIKELAYASDANNGSKKFNFSFNSGREYREFEESWRTNYLNLSLAIRYGKEHRKPSRAGYDARASMGLCALRKEAALEMLRLKAAQDLSRSRRLAAKAAAAAVSA